MFTKLLLLFGCFVIGQGRPQEFEGHQTHPIPFTVFASDHTLVSNPVNVVTTVQENHEEGHSVDYHAHPKYEYKYGVTDPHTHDEKSQVETRDGEHTQGEYTLKEPDGTELNVHYSIDGKSGFNAIVTRKGHAIHPQHYKTYGHTN